MSELISRCLGTDGAHSCADQVTATVPVPLCTRHRMQVALAIVPEMLASVMAQTAQVDLTATALAVQPDFSGPHDPRVYFVVNGDRVKIGLTSNLKNRLHRLCHPRESVALLLDGGRNLEAALHRRFDSFRMADSEWFRITPEINEYVADKVKGLPGVVHASRAGTLDDSTLIAALHKVAAPHVYLSELADEVGLTKDETRRRVEGLGIIVRRAVRNGESTAVGVHKDDLPPLAAA